MANDEQTLFFLLLAFAAIIIAFRYAYERERSRALRLVAQTLGFSFEKSPSINMLEKFGDFHLFSLGHGRRIRNLMWGRRNRCDVTIFGYEYEQGQRNESRTIRQTVLLFESNGKQLPNFELRPEKLFHKIGQAFGYQDIDFEKHPVFSDLFILRGQDEPSIRRLFTPNIISFLEQHHAYGLCLEGQENKLLCYRQSKRSNPNGLKTFLELGESIQRMFSVA